MDKILEAYVADFAEDFNLATSTPPLLFEHFVNYCAIAPELMDPLDLADIHVAGGGDTAIDGVAIIVNDRLITSPEQLDDVARLRGRLEVSFVFTQAKMGTKFNAAEIGSFLFGVKEFFNPSSALPSNKAISQRRGLADKLFAKSINFRRNPELRLFYATTGEWLGDATVQARVDAELAQLRSLHLFSSVEFKPLDATGIKAKYKNQKRRLVQEIEFERHAIIPRLEGVAVAYIGILSAQEYLKLITAPDNRLNKAVFYENIRDFQGDTPVNTEIQSTLLNAESQSLLPILNNGVTIVARSIEPTGTRFRLTDYQVVNGCQTSHALFFAQDELKTAVHIPVKLIATEDPDITARIIRATNRQTEIKPEAFIALSPFHKQLEDLYEAMSRGGVHPLFYERRSRQYDGTSVRPHQVVTVAAQVASFTAVFLEEPHSCHRYYGEVIAAYRDRLFREDHSVLPYFLSSFILYRLEGLFRNNVVPAYLRPLKYHIAMMTRIGAGGGSLPPLASKKMDDYCGVVLNKLSDNRISASTIEAACDKVKQQLMRAGDEAESPRVRSFTQALLRG
ncbi:AIPR family protein [Polyangium jinanense]|uniref:AIPR family protein n=1 Tax=Polyangium jinanense TaxID=2829994 RepID=A0A9X3X4X3_9BACT|nr:AIPR family protein [Polyangium jinanense]MDC3984325.1 AIPR family protein [Polyangium jinanense]MDC3984342.1 AIPR family protein [Polyangium jinanense]